MQFAGFKISLTTRLQLRAAFVNLEVVCGALWINYQQINVAALCM